MVQNIRVIPRQHHGAQRLLRGAGLLLCCLLLSASLAWAEPTRRLVEFHPGTPVATQQDIINTSGSTLLKRLPLVNAAAIKLPAATSQTALDYLHNRPEVKQIHADPQVSAQSETEGMESQLITPTAPPVAGYPWNLLQIARNQVAAMIQGQGVKIAVLDTGIATSHPALAGVVMGGYNAVMTTGADAAAAGEGGDGEGGDGEGGDSSNYQDCNGHGTHVAGIIASSTVGIAPQAKLYAVRVLDCQGEGFVSDLISGLSWVYEQPQIRVVNMSLGFYKTSPYPLLQQAMSTLYEAGVVLVTAAGNYRSDCLVNVSGSKRFVINPLGCNTRVKFPGRYAETIAVAATDSNSKITYYSIRGPEVDIAAPGGTLLNPIISTTVQSSTSTISSGAAGEGGEGEGGDGEGGDGEGGDGEGGDSTGVYGSGSGTSMAAPHVTGVVALMLSIKPTLTPADVRAILRNTATVLPMLSASSQGRGRLHAAAAVAAAASWTGLPPTPYITIIHPSAQIDASVVLGNYVTINANAIMQAAGYVMDYALVKDYVMTGVNTTLGKYTLTEKDASLGTNVAIGHHTLLKKNSQVGTEGEDVFGVSLGDYVLIEENVMVGTNVRIGDYTTLKKNVHVGDRTTIGNQTLIETNVVMGHDVTVGNNVLIKAYAVVCNGTIIPDNALVAPSATGGTCL